jgi:hypothetical protein
MQSLSVLRLMALGLHLKETLFSTKWTKPNNHLPNKIVPVIFHKVFSIYLDKLNVCY